MPRISGIAIDAHCSAEVMLDLGPRDPQLIFVPALALANFRASLVLSSDECS